ncbi:MAG: hypothetical protein KAS94_00515, partial [Desulfobulbaceae bacterium]|nr:hypothetical protein [Desulfobulbaceae bacterium]
MGVARVSALICQMTAMRRRPRQFVEALRERRWRALLCLPVSLSYSDMIDFGQKRGRPGEVAAKIEFWITKRR